MVLPSAWHSCSIDPYLHDASCSTTKVGRPLIRQAATILVMGIVEEIHIKMRPTELLGKCTGMIVSMEGWDIR